MASHNSRSFQYLFASTNNVIIVKTEAAITINPKTIREYSSKSGGMRSIKLATKYNAATAPNKIPSIYANTLIIFLTPVLKFIIFNIKMLKAVMANV